MSTTDTLDNWPPNATGSPPNAPRSPRRAKAAVRQPTPTACRNWRSAYGWGRQDDRAVMVGGK